MKSAYELAMERLQAQSPDRTLTDAQKAELAEIDSLYESKIAERKVFLEGEIRKAQAQQTDSSELERQLALEVRRLESEREEKKDALRG